MKRKGHRQWFSGICKKKKITGIKTVLHDLLGCNLSNTSKTYLSLMI